jgi:hypothetical protein
MVPQEPVDCSRGGVDNVSLKKNVQKDSNPPVSYELPLSSRMSIVQFVSIPFVAYLTNSTNVNIISSIKQRTPSIISIVSLVMSIQETIILLLR